MAVVMLLLLLPVCAVPAAAADVEMERGDNQSLPLGEVLAFGGRQWYVLGHNNSNFTANGYMMLLSRERIGNFQSFGANGTYSGSALHTTMLGYAGDPNPADRIVSEKEFSKISPMTVGSLANQYFWPLSVAQAQQIQGLEPSLLQVNAPAYSWWLMNAGATTGAAYVDADGNVVATGQSPTAGSTGVRAGVRLYTNNSILMFSAADGAGSKLQVSAGGTGMTPVASAGVNGVKKMTFIVPDTTYLNLNIPTAELHSRTVKPGATISIPFSDAVTGENRSVSVLITDTDYKPLHYARVSTQASGNARFTIPTTLAEGNYKLRLFNEQINGVNESDFASTPKDITLVVDATKPQVTATAPNDQALVGFTANTLSVTFSEEMDVSTPVTGAVSLNNGATLTNPVWDANNKTIRYTMSGLKYATTHTLSITGFTDAVGNMMNPDTTRTFTVETDDVKPTVVEVAPGIAAVNVPVSTSTLRVKFSEPMNTTLPTGGLVALGGNSVLTNPQWSADGTTVEYDLAGLDYYTTYYYAISGFRDAQNNLMDPILPETGGLWFTTQADTHPPLVTTTAPARGAANVPVDTASVSVTFDERMTATYPVTGSVVLNNGAVLTNPSWSTDERTITYELSGLAHDTTYTYTISGFSDLIGNVMNVDSGRQFSTGGAPAHNVTLTVNKDGAPYTAHGKTFTLRQGGSVLHTGAGTDGTVAFSNVTDGSYQIFDTGVDTGETVLVAGVDAAKTLNYYTVSYTVANAGSASGSTVSASYGGSSIQSGAVVLGGRQLTITAQGAGAASYTYAWAGEGTAGETGATFTRNPLNAT